MNPTEVEILLSNPAWVEVTGDEVTVAAVTGADMAFVVVTGDPGGGRVVHSVDPGDGVREALLKRGALKDVRYFVKVAP